MENTETEREELTEAEAKVECAEATTRISDFTNSPEVQEYLQKGGHYSGVLERLKDIENGEFANANSAEIDAIEQAALSTTGVDVDNKKEEPEGLEDITLGLSETKEKLEDPSLTTSENEGDEEEVVKGKKKTREKDKENEEDELDGDRRPNGREEEEEHEDEPDGDKNKKSKEKGEKEDSSSRREQQKQETIERIKLPSGMTVEQNGPHYELVSKDGKHRTDITPVMDAIDKYNRNADATNEANAENQAQNEAQAGVEQVAKGEDMDTQGKDVGKNGIDTPEISDNKIKDVEASLPEIKDVNGSDLFKPEDVEAFAKFALSESEINTLREKGLMDELAQKNKENNEKKNKKSDKPLGYTPERER